jgi:hypothetical protein
MQFRRSAFIIPIVVFVGAVIYWTLFQTAGAHVIHVSPTP